MNRRAFLLSGVAALVAAPAAKASLKAALRQAFNASAAPLFRSGDRQVVASFTGKQIFGAADIYVSDFGRHRWDREKNRLMDLP